MRILAPFNLASIVSLYCCFISVCICFSCVALLLVLLAFIICFFFFISCAPRVLFEFYAFRTIWMGWDGMSSGDYLFRIHIIEFVRNQIFNLVITEN